jgi:hypothetical protein
MPLDNSRVVGVWTSRGERAYQEDATSVAAIEVDTDEIRASLPVDAWDGNGADGRQVEVFGIYDG